MGVKPRLGALQRASIRIPSLPGYITINATRSSTSVEVPCGTRAKICASHFASNALAASSMELELDGTIDQEATIEGPWLCSNSRVGCGRHGIARKVAVRT